MNIVNSGNRFQVYGDAVKTYHALPVASYGVQFSDMSGFFLTHRDDLAVTEEKIYGKSNEKVAKVLRSYHIAKRNFGVLLSGQKGIGKSLFVRLLAQAAIQEGLPVIVVNTAIPGISDFLSSIDQNCVVIFDEFEKTFAKTKEYNPQDEMLTLFDGIEGGHKLFIVTCNNLSDLSPYMLNRPGRFHYHFSMTAPSQDEVREYLTDTVDPKYSEEIDQLVALSGAVDMPYDYLRAIAFELNQGYTLKETLNDLNISRADCLYFDIMAIRKDGSVYEAWREKIYMTDMNSVKWVSVRNFERKHQFGFSFTPALATIVDGEYVVTDGIDMDKWDEDDFYELPEEKRAAAAEAENSNPVVRVVLKKCPETGPIRFTV